VERNSRGWAGGDPKSRLPIPGKGEKRAFGRAGMKSASSGVNCLAENNNSKGRIGGLLVKHQETLLLTYRVETCYRGKRENERQEGAERRNGRTKEKERKTSGSWR